MVNTPSPTYLHSTLARWSIRGGVFFALWLSMATPASAVSIDSQDPSPVAGANDNDDTSLLNRDTDTFTLQVRRADVSEEGPFGLTSGELAIDRNITLSEPPASLLLAKRDRGASADSIVHVDSKHTVAIEDLAVNDGLALPMQLVMLTAGGIALLCFSLALSYRQLQRPRGKRVRFGILWHAFQPICGKCGRALSVLNDYSFQCPSCRVELAARGENGKTISPQEALVKIRLKEYW